MIFGRTSEIDKLFALVAKYLGFAMIISNCYFTFGYLQGRLGIGSDDLKFIASVTVSLLVTIVEAATFSALFNPELMLRLMGRSSEAMRHPDDRARGMSDVAQNAALVALCVIAVLAFWFDYNASISQLKVTSTIESRIIAAVFVMGGEILFACQNILLQNTKTSQSFQEKKSSSGGSGALAPKTAPKD